jgi:hypothetical protein
MGVGTESLERTKAAPRAIKELIDATRRPDAQAGPVGSAARV